MSIRKRAAAIGAAVVMIGTAGPVALAGAAPVPVSASAPPTPAAVGPIGGAFQAGAAAAIGGFNAGTAGAVGCWNAGAAALGMPFQFTVNGGPFGINTAGVAPLVP